jgi:hypothetical protein
MATGILGPYFSLFPFQPPKAPNFNRNVSFEGLRIYFHDTSPGRHIPVKYLHHNVTIVTFTFKNPEAIK